MNHSTSRNFVLIAIIEGQLKRGKCNTASARTWHKMGKRGKKWKFQKNDFFFLLPVSVGAFVQKNKIWIMLSGRQVKFNDRFTYINPIIDLFTY